MAPSLRKLLLLQVLIVLGCAETFVIYDEEKEDFILKEGTPEEGSITIDPGESCKVVDDIFVVCGK